MDISELGKQPVAPQHPAGTDVRYAPSFDELQTEVDKLSSPAAAGSLDWEKVARLATEILEKTSKDLLAASYLAVALIHTRKHQGFNLGLKVYLELMEEFWERLYPQKTRMRGRLRAVEWWVEKTEAALKQHEGASLTREELALAGENLDRLEEFLSRNLPDAPSLAPIRNCLAGLSLLPGDQPEKDATEVPSRPAGAGGASAASDSSPEKETRPDRAESPPVAPAPRDAALQDGPSLQQEPARALNDALLCLSEASFYLWQQELASPHPYRLRREISWYAVNELPPAVDGRTRIPPPSSREKQLLLDLVKGGDAEALLKAAETRQAQFIFWIDLSRMVANALDLLGSPYRQAHDAVCQETAFLLLRLPGLEALSFSDGTPFATQETRNWLKRIALRPARPIPDGAAPLGPALSQETGAEAMIEKKIHELQELVRMGKLVEAMEVVQLKLRTSYSRRENLLWRLSLSQMLVDLGQSRLALPHLEQVLRDIEGHGLEQYDPVLAMRGFKLAWLAFDCQEEQRFKEQAQEVLHQIGRFDMPEMVRLTTG